MPRISKQTCLLVITQEWGAHRGSYSHISTFKRSTTQHACSEFPKSIMAIFLLCLEESALGWRLSRENSTLGQQQNSTSAWLPCFCCVKCCPHRGYFFLFHCAQVCFGSVDHHVLPSGVTFPNKSSEREMSLRSGKAYIRSILEGKKVLENVDCNTVRQG